MSIKKTVLTTLFATAIAFNGSVQAHESHVDRVLSTMVNQAMEIAKTEINNEVQKSIFTSAYDFTFALPIDSSAPSTKVTIIDIANAKSTESVGTENSED
ncbi:MAG: hypothetical protein ACI89W_000381 [Gammaproteobacteria bacterium]|jgi:hypothetical protein